MAEFIQKYEVQKGRTVTCKMGVAHAEAKLSLENFSGDDQEKKQKMIDKLVENKALKPVPMTDEEKEAKAKAEEAKENAKKEVEKKREEALSKKEEKPDTKSKKGGAKKK